MVEADEVEVWQIRLPDDGRTPPGHLLLLSQEEADRAARFVFDRDRARFTVAHAALRRILGSHAGENPHDLAILVEENGKPYLAEHRDLRFNLSHSGSWALLAVARNREVGVDIEFNRGERPTEGIAERFFATAEVQELMNVPDDQRLAAFFDCWSRKEAYIKARGDGLRIPLESFEVSLGDKAILRKAVDRERWSMCALQAPPGYAAALVVEGTGWRLKQLLWTGHPDT